VTRPPSLSNSKEKAHAVPNSSDISISIEDQLPASFVPLDLKALHVGKKEFWSFVDKSSDCWEWTGSTRKGYGKFHPSRGVTISAHRYSYLLAYGIDPGGQLVCHKCDNRICVRPTHLFLGSHQDNSDDKIAKGRNITADLSGTRNPRARLTEQQVEEIRCLIMQGGLNTEIAKEYGVSHGMISRIRLGKAWTGRRSKASINVKVGRPISP
jgi:hypothetical protein